MIARKLTVGTTLFGLILLTVAADADPPKVGPATTPAVQAGAVKRTPFKAATKPPLTVSADQRAKVRDTLTKALAEFAKDKNASRLMTAGAGLGAEVEPVYRAVAAGLLSAQSSRGVVAAPGRQLALVAATYSIEAGEVVAASTSSPCAGDIQIAFTVKNKGDKLPAGKTARLFASLARADAPATVISSAWVALPSLDNGASTTVQLPALRHRAPSAGGGCPSGDIVVTPSFVEVKAAMDYRLQIQLTNNGADATLLSGIFLAPGAGNSSGGSSSGGANQCSPPNQQCASGVCSFFCPPCPGTMVETADGGCAISLGGPIGF